MRRVALPDYAGQLAAAARAVSFVRGSFAWLGQSQPRPAKALREQMSPDMLRRRLLSDLTLRLYRDFYCTGRPQAQRLADDAAHTSATSGLVRALSDANSGAGQVQEGWQLVDRRDDALGIRRGDLVLWADPSELLAPSGSSDLRIRVPREMLGYSPGYYMALSDWQFPRDGERIWRLYWNLPADAAASFVSVASRELNGREIPFLLKVANSADRFQRCDSAVIYLARSDLESCGATLQTLCATFGHRLRAPVPALTKPLARGVALAEDPGDGESFGWHRSQLLAEALLRAHDGGASGVEQRLAAIAERFAEAGVDPTAPYREVRSAEPVIDLGTTTRRPRACRGRLDPLRVATAIGRRLASDAMWWNGRCTWVGAEPVDLRATSARPSWSTVGAELYEGTAGIASFLAEIGVRTSDVGCLSCAAGAMRQSLETAGTCPPGSRLGLYSGWTGIALAAIRIGRLLGADDLQERGYRLCIRAFRHADASSACDVVSGRAGATLALMSLARLLDDSALLERARTLAGTLLSLAARADDGRALSWRSGLDGASLALTGYAHGASGIAHAFLELFDATGETAYRTAALQAFAYERLHYDRHAANWRDLRRRVGGVRRHAPFMSAWCHGAPGIALARLRAVELLGDGVWCDELAAALTTTAANLDDGLANVRSNFSLCHGLAGNADIVLEAGRRLGPRSPADASLVEQAASHGAQLYGGSLASWPCGAGHGSTPGLMLGLSGIGYFYLRLHDAAVPSVLLVRSAPPGPAR